MSAISLTALSKLTLGHEFGTHDRPHIVGRMAYAARHPPPHLERFPPRPHRFASTSTRAAWSSRPQVRPPCRHPAVGARAFSARPATAGIEGGVAWGGDAWVGASSYQDPAPCTWVLTIGSKAAGEAAGISWLSPFTRGPPPTLCLTDKASVAMAPTRLTNAWAEPLNRRIPRGCATKTRPSRPIGGRCRGSE